VKRPRRAACAAAFVVVALAVAAPVRGATVTVPGTSATVDASGYVDGLAIVPVGGPRQQPGLSAELSLLGKVSRSLRLQLTTRSHVGGPYEGGHAGFMNFVHEFQNRSTSFEVNEAFAELRLGDAQVRAGIQKFAWGKLDGAPPTDVLTPRDLHDPLVRDYEESKIGIPALQLTYYLPPVPSLDLHDLKTSLVYIPFAVPPRAPLAEERWFPPSIQTGGTTIPKTLADALSFDRNVPVAFHTLNSRPPGTFDAGGIAFRLGGTVHDMDWSISHYTGPETGADGVLEAQAICRQCATQMTDRKIHARAVLRQDHDVIHMTGADWSAAFGGATVRAEVAAFQNRPYLRSSSQVVDEALQQVEDAVVQGKRPPAWSVHLLKGKWTRVPLADLFPDRDSVEWGIGADYLIEGFLPLLQVNQVVFTDNGPTELLSNPETRIVASVKRRFLADALEVEVRGVYAFTRDAWFLYPRATYHYGDHMRFRLGYLAIGGPVESVIGQYRKNDELTLEARYSF
jgi:hypothetical protein